ncbi:MULTISPECIES: hypothetical protein [Sulfitobacter]|jgi:hypothetical protein|uniref:Uncharacterized protein n=1 Tax=Sulfitobacter profundi TaxID=2679961 RepID=A0ABW1YZV4_9RHOB|nr:MULTISPECIES: hypothetical protein [unclassified Sulfitobacter]UWR39230.1 hypothetical protein K3762_01650 [Sulfitobacter sp. W074]WOI17286.1 hypothetical protein R1T45_06775 [Sulfitobacter sp. LC.270.F.C4]
MICPMVEQAHLGTTRYTMLSLSVIHVPGKPMLTRLLLALTVLSNNLAFAQKSKEMLFIQSVFTIN